MKNEKISNLIKLVKEKLGLSSFCKKDGEEKSGFTLIELLIVIAIIGILAGVLIAVINPAQQRLKANQAVMRSSVSKACLAAV
ncbi:MAG: type II secretion system protein, partial [Patescibacteria group bacterium]